MFKRFEKIGVLPLFRSTPSGIQTGSRSSDPLDVESANIESSKGYWSLIWTNHMFGRIYINLPLRVDIGGLWRFTEVPGRDDPWALIVCIFFPEIIIEYMVTLLHWSGYTLVCTYGNDTLWIYACKGRGESGNDTNHIRTQWSTRANIWVFNKQTVTNMGADTWMEESNHMISIKFSSRTVWGAIQPLILLQWLPREVVILFSSVECCWSESGSLSSRILEANLEAAETGTCLFLMGAIGVPGIWKSTSN